jgi:hypothetical protein
MAVFERLQSRLSKVPGVTSEDIAVWVQESEAESGLTEEENENAILYLALSIGYEAICADAARFFKYGDGEENVDKSTIFANYMSLAKDARKNYRKQVRGRFGASQSHTSRADKR